MLITLFFGYECKNLRVSIKLKEQLPQGHPYVQIYNKLGELFGSGDGNESVLVIGVTANDPNENSVYSPKMLQKVVDMTNGLKKMPFVIQPSIISFSAPNIKEMEGTEEMFDVHPLLDPTKPVTAESAEHVKSVLKKDRILRELLVNTKGTTTTIAMDVDGSEPDEVIQRKVDDLLNSVRDESVTLSVAGGPPLRMEINRYTALAFPLMILAIVLIGIIHYHAFRTRQAAILPLVTAILSTVWAMGILGIVGRPLDSWSAITPIIILAVAAGHAVQILKRYYEEFAIDKNSKEAVVRALCAVGPVMLRVGIIASFGFGSLVFVGVESVRVFGLLLSAGILSALVIEMTLIPAWRSATTPTSHESSRESHTGFIERVISSTANWATTNVKQSFVVTILVVIFFGIGIQWMEVNNNIYKWLPYSSPIRQDYERLTDELGGATSFKLWVEGEREDAIKEPEVLAALNDLEMFLREQKGLNRIFGFSGLIIRRMHKAMDGKDTVPSSKGLVEQYLLLYSTDSLHGLVDDSFTNSVIVGFMSDDSTEFIDHSFENIRKYVDKRFAGLPAKIHVAGGALAVNAAMDQVVIAEKWHNMIQVSSVIFVLATLFLWSVVGGLFVLIPMILALVVNMGMMGWFGIWFDMTSAAITAMGISIGADFAIYFLYRVREEVARGTHATFEDAVRQALLTSGKAIFYVSSAVIGGFMALYLSPFLVWQHLAVLTSLIILVHALSVIVLLPSLIIYFRPKFLLSQKPSSAMAK
jgi:hypothetical protein